MRALVGKAVDVIEQADRAPESGEALWRSGCPDGPTDPNVIVRQHAAAQLDREGVPRNDLDRLVTELSSANYRARLAEVEAEIPTPYLDA